jgi:hypothetical protein
MGLGHARRNTESPVFERTQADLTLQLFIKIGNLSYKTNMTKVK